jgi:uncharacterized membrane protein
MSTNKDLTPKSDVPSGADGRPTNNLNVAVKNVHVYANDIHELTKLAEVDPELAHKLADQRERQSIREESSFRLGLVAALGLLATLIFGVVYVVINAGVVALALTIGVILATALLIRVIITGEWSETTWVGSFLKFALKKAGGSFPDDKKTEGDRMES